MTKLVYVASPFSKIDKKKAFKIAKKACKKVESFDVNFYPISPVLLWGDIKAEVTKHDRYRNLEACKKLLLGCDFIYVANNKHIKESEGICLELLIAEENHIRQLKD